MSRAERCPRCGAVDPAFVDHDGACAPVCAVDLDLDLDLDLGLDLGEPDPDVERWEIEERRADARRARWGHE